MIVNHSPDNRRDIMPIDIETEEIRTLAQAARSLPKLRKNRPVAPSTLWRWAQRGIKGHRLETTKIGGTTVTSKEALQRFFDAVNGNGTNGTVESHATSRARARKQDEVESHLNKLGA